MCQILAVTNTKGGVSKTTTAVHLADWLIDKGHRVIYINASFQKGVHEWLRALDIPFYQEKDAEELLNLIESIETEADYILIDVPGASEIVKTILDCCDRALVPIKPAMLDLEDCITLLNIIKRKQKLRPDLHVDYFISRVDGRSNADKEAAEYFNYHKIKLLDARIRELKIIADTPAYRSTVFNLDDAKAKQVAQDYDRLFTKFLNYA